MSKAFHELFHDGAVHLTYAHAIFICIGLTIVNVTTYIVGFSDCRRKYEQAAMMSEIARNHEKTKKGLFN